MEAGNEDSCAIFSLDDTINASLSSCLDVLTAKIKSTYQWFPFVLDGWLNKNSLTTAEMIPEHKDPGIVWNVDIN